MLLDMKKTFCLLLVVLTFSGCGWFRNKEPFMVYYWITCNRFETSVDTVIFQFDHELTIKGYHSSDTCQTTSIIKFANKGGRSYRLVDADYESTYILPDDSIAQHIDKYLGDTIRVYYGNQIDTPAIIWSRYDEDKSRNHIYEFSNWQMTSTAVYIGKRDYSFVLSKKDKVD